MHRGAEYSEQAVCPHPWAGPEPFIGTTRVVLLLLWMVSAGCSLTQEVSRTPRNAVEQLLLSQAVGRALEDLHVPLPAGESVRVEVSGLQTDRAHLHLDEQDDSFGVIDSPSWDLGFVRDLLSGRLGELGYRVRRRGEEATYLVRVMVEAMGTNQGKTFLAFRLFKASSFHLPFPNSDCIKSRISSLMFACTWSSLKSLRVVSSGRRRRRSGRPTTINIPCSFSLPSGRLIWRPRHSTFSANQFMSSGECPGPAACE